MKLRTVNFKITSGHLCQKKPSFRSPTKEASLSRIRKKKSLRQRRGGTSGLEAFARPEFLVPAAPETWTGVLGRGSFSAGSAAPYRAYFRAWDLPPQSELTSVLCRHRDAPVPAYRET